MSEIKKWTPIQEGRFHLRSMRPGETFYEYTLRIFPRPLFTDVYRRGQRNRLQRLINSARREAAKAAKASAEEQGDDLF